MKGKEIIEMDQEDWEKFKESECIFINGEWYKIEKEIYADYADIFICLKKISLEWY